MPVTIMYIRIILRILININSGPKANNINNRSAYRILVVYNKNKNEVEKIASARGNSKSKNVHL